MANNLPIIREATRHEKTLPHMPDNSSEEEPIYPPIRTVALLIFALYVAVFLVALGRFELYIGMIRILLTVDFRPHYNLNCCAKDHR